MCITKLWFVNLAENQIMNRSSRPGVFCKKGALRNFAKFTGKHLCQSLNFNKVAGWGLQLYKQPGTFLKKRLWCFPVNFTEFLKTPFLSEHIRWLLVNERQQIVKIMMLTSIPLQKQPFIGILKIVVLRNFGKFTGNHLCRSLF